MDAFERFLKERHGGCVGLYKPDEIEERRAFFRAGLCRAAEIAEHGINGPLTTLENYRAAFIRDAILAEANKVD